eukprot:gb/GECH01004741.1/.p1 GENE.gb/GECH01004741.1/~~gb/GECH01004741.1/.p1  ORF type:complete len:453 (+),score=113.07 gb/GECH01004741.1/:1-1359(+)
MTKTNTESTSGITRGSLPKTAVEQLKAWLFEHFEHPYPSEEQKQELSNLTNLSLNQVNNWFVNARVRIWRPLIEKKENIKTEDSQLSTSTPSPVNETITTSSPPTTKQENTTNEDTQVNQVNNKKISGSGSSGTPSVCRGNLPKTAVEKLRAWLYTHFDHPYPTDDEKETLAQETQLTLTQVNNWFINARRRVWRPIMEKKNTNENPSFTSVDAEKAVREAAATSSKNKKHRMQQTRANQGKLKLLAPGYSGPVLRNEAPTTNGNGGKNNIGGLGVQQIYNPRIPNTGSSSVSSLTSKSSSTPFSSNSWRRYPSRPPSFEDLVAQHDSNKILQEYKRVTDENQWLKGELYRLSHSYSRLFSFHKSFPTSANNDRTDPNPSNEYSSTGTPIQILQQPYRSSWPPSSLSSQVKPKIVPREGSCFKDYQKHKAQKQLCIEALGVHPPPTKRQRLS